MTQKTKPLKAPKPRKAKSLDVFRTISDESGNLVVIRDNKVRLILSLKLASETKKRRIGIVNLARKTFEVKRKRDKHLFRKSLSYGFNHKILSDAKLFDTIRLSDEHQEWVIPKSYILENGHFLHFKSAGGFERQIFIELVKISQFEKPKKF